MAVKPLDSDIFYKFFVVSVKYLSVHVISFQQSNRQFLSDQIFQAANNLIPVAKSRIASIVVVQKVLA